MRVLHVNSLAASGCVARIAGDIVRVSQSEGNEDVFAFGRGDYPEFRSYRIGTKADFLSHSLLSRLFDAQGFGSRRSTRKFLRWMRGFGPDVVHLHNVHGSYLNIELLFKELARNGAGVVWTLHDCWPFTGHCSYYDFAQCSKWRTHCEKCPSIHEYPKSWLVDRSRDNFRIKKELFTSLDPARMIIATPSEWLAREARESFLGKYEVMVVPNSIDCATFCPKGTPPEDEVVLLGVANKWHRVKGLDDWRELSKRLGAGYRIVLVGEIDERDKAGFGEHVVFAGRVKGASALSEYYSEADIFANFTHEDNFPTVNIEALACGTPVLTYDTGGSPEAIDERTGWVTAGFDEALEVIARFEKSPLRRDACIERSRLFCRDVYSAYTAAYRRLALEAQ